MEKESKKVTNLLRNVLEKLINKTDNNLISKSEIYELFEEEYNLYEKLEKSLNFREATLEKLMEIVNIQQVDNETKFEEWFSYKYELYEEEKSFLKELIKENKFYLNSYNEQTLTVKFIGFILNKVKFRNKKIKDWYEYSISCKLNNWTLKGYPDFFVATGINEPKKPYFFLQEYKKSVNPTGNPEYQVLAAMLAAIEKNNTNTIKGGYIIGAYWKFMILEKLENGNYEYFVSDGLDALNFINLKKIYIYLQAVKHLYCKY